MLRIAEAREARGWTQEQLAQALGTTQQTVQRWESGQVDPQVSKIEAISKALGITVTFLLGIDLKEVSEPAPARQEEELSDDERRLVGMYRKMGAQYRAMMLKSAEAFVGASERDADVPGEAVSA